MQTDGSHDAGPSGLPSSSSNLDTSSSRFQPSANMRDRLEKLAKWRIDQSSIEFPKEAREVSGGHATVSQAFMGSPRGGTDITNQSDPTKNKGLNSSGSTGETSHRRKTVAVKRMKMSDDIARVLGLTVREAEFLAGLSHESIIELEGFVEDLSKDVIWLVLPWEENGALRDFIASAEWEVPERISLIRDVARGVEYLHSQQPPICHGDLKSLNVLVNSKCRAIITDFGSARLLKTEDLNEEMKPAQNNPLGALSLEASFCAATNTITLTGDHYTLRWAAPELLYDEKPGLCSDIWAFGWVAYEVMTGFIPFQDVKDTVVIKRVVQGDLPSLTGDARMSLSQALCSLMLLCWSIDSSKRPTAEDCRIAISWMPMVVPKPTRTSDTAASRTRSPWLLLKLGETHWRQGDYVSALECITSALGGYKDAGDREGMVTALVELGQVYRFQGYFDRAIQHYSEALGICTDIGDRQGRASALFGLAEVYLGRAEYEKAFTFYSKVLQLRSFISKQRRANALSGLAEVHRGRAEYSEAITFYSEALQIRTEIGDSQGRANSIWGLAEVHRARNEFSQAITFYSEVLQIRTETGDKLGKAQTLRGLAEVHRLRNEFSQAIKLLLEALQISTDMGDRYGRAVVLSRLADVHRVQENHSDAIKFYTGAAEVFEEIGHPQWMAYVSNQAAKVRGISDRKEAT